MNITSSRKGTGGNARNSETSSSCTLKTGTKATKGLKISIFLNELFYGSLMVTRFRGGVREEDLIAEIEQRLPLLKNKKYTIEI